jgi:DNA-binding NarL/FixJ family response regulator
VTRILLVDDHRSVLWGLAKLIESAGPPLELVGTACSATQALEAVHQHRPDIVLLDLMLGTASGVELVAEMRQAGASVIILSGVTDPLLQERAVLEGASGFVHKSEPAEVILKAIARVSAGELWLEPARAARLFSALCQARRTGTRGDALSLLTPAERKVIAEVVRHKSKPNKVIAGALGISAHTLRNHLASIYDKLALNRRLDLVLFALERHLDRPAALPAAPAPRPEPKGAVAPYQAR